MPTVPIAPLFLSESDLLIAADDFGAHISSGKFVPSSSTVTWKGAKKDAVFSAGTTPTWVLTLNYAQDWESAKSLSQYLLANQGTEKEITLKPRSGGPGYKANVIIQPGDIGGDVDSYGTATVSLGVLGAPVKVTGA